MRFGKSAGGVVPQILSVAVLLQSALAVVTTGVTGGVAQRLEIRTLAQNADQWNLYLLGMQKFQQVNEDDPLSYYQIAGIHGVPYTTYDGVTCVNQGGYCTHVMTLFASWHRPYLALFEQQLLANVQAVVNSFPAGATRNRYAAAAKTLRMPYWDWAMAPTNGVDDVPTLIRDQTVSVVTPSGTQTIANPLYSYKFNPLRPNDMLGSPYTIWQTTFRRPVTNDPNVQSARSNNNEFASTMNANRISLRDRVYNLMTQSLTYNEIATECVGNGCGNTNSHDSFESVHDVIHTISGGPTGGHMYYLDFSAFDPVFWLHHTNIDRLVSMWQTINPDNFLTPGNLQSSNCQWDAGQSKNAYTPLKPFKKDTAGDFWTSEDVRQTTVLGYNYPETANGATAASVRSAVNKLYSSSSSSKKRWLSNRFEGRAAQEGDRDYKVVFNAEKHCLGTSYDTYVFLGPHNASCTPETCIKDPNFVGIYGVLAKKTDYSNGTVGNYHVSNNTLPKLAITGEVPLTTALQGKVATGELAGLDEASVTAYLAKNLNWQVIKGAGEVIAADQVPGLVANVVSATITPALSDDEFPIFGTPTSHPEATSGKPAGATSPLQFLPNPAAVEQGTCASPVVKYVDEAGNFLYNEMGGEALI